MLDFKPGDVVVCYVLPPDTYSDSWESTPADYVEADVKQKTFLIVARSSVIGRHSTKFVTDCGKLILYTNDIDDLTVFK